MNQLLIQRVLNQQKFDAKVINLAGRQRMLSQKIVKDTYSVLENNSGLTELKDEVKNFNLVHTGLQKGNESLGLPPLNSKIILGLFVELNPIQKRLTGSILEAEVAEDIIAMMPLIRKNEMLFLQKMDEIVFQFELESNERIRQLIALEIILAAVSLIVLLSEFLFIFKPLFEKLYTDNEKLNESVREILESKGALFKSIQRYNLSIDGINAGVWDWYIPDGTEWWSDRFYDLLGYKRDEVPASYNTFLHQLVHPDDKEKVEKAVENHLKNKARYKVEIRMKTKSQGYRWFESVGLANWDFDDNPIRMVGSIIDIEEKKQLESQLTKDLQILSTQNMEFEKVLRQLSEIQKVAHIGTWSVDLRTMTANWSEEVYRIHEVPVGTEINVETSINFYREDFRPIVQKAIDTAISEKKPWDLECILETAKGNELPVRAIGYPVFERGVLTSLRGLFMNLSKTEKNL